MRSLAPTLGLLALAGLVALAPAPAQAQHPCPGTVSATALRPVPANASIALGGRADTDAERAAQAAVTAALGRTRHPVSGAADFILSWRGGLASDGTGRSMMIDDTDPFHDSDDLHWMQDAPRMGRRPAPPAAPSLRVNGQVELRDHASGRVVWTAVFSCSRQGNDQAALAATLANAIVPLIGQQVSGRPF